MLEVFNESSQINVIVTDRRLDTVFTAIVGQIGLLKPREVKEVIVFYNHLNSFQSRAFGLGVALDEFHDESKKTLIDKSFVRNNISAMLGSLESAEESYKAMKSFSF